MITVIWFEFIPQKRVNNQNQKVTVADQADLLVGFDNPTQFANKSYYKITEFL